MDTDGIHPLPGFLHAPVAGGEQDFPTAGLQGHAHTMVAGHAVPGFREVAEIVFEEIHAPLREGLGIDILMVIAGGVTRTGPNAGAGIHAELQTFAVDVIGHGLHAVGEFLMIRNQAAIFVPLHFRPAVINDQIFISSGQIALFHHGISCFHNEFFVDICSKRIPGIPSHRGAFCQHIRLSFS